MNLRPSRISSALAALCLFALAPACKKKEAPPAGALSKPTTGATAAGAGAGRPAGKGAVDPKMTRQELNQLAVRANVPVFWREDSNRNGAPDPDEVHTALFYPAAPRWVERGKLTPAFQSALRALVAAKAEPVGTAAEVARRKLVRDDLDQGMPTLVYSDLRALSAPEKAFVAKMLEVSKRIEALYGKLNGTEAARAAVPKDDPASQSLLRRNWTPRCRAPKTEKNPACSAIPGAPPVVFDLYPAALQKDEKFCAALEKHPDSKALLAPFVVVREEAGKLVPVPYHVAYKAEMGEIARGLREAAAALPEGEVALRAYLEAAAQAFVDGNWEAADEKWAAMNAHNSKWYLRVAPDETYWEPCRMKAGFHVTFARINPDSLAWQKKLEPLRQEMEDALGALIGPAYKTHKATFKLPDFVDIVWNAGDDRQPFGATIGQSLPNWGRVANESRGRTVAMSNLFQDPESLAVRRRGAESLIVKESLVHYNDGKTPGLLNTILHEATHNLGPSHEYTVDGKSATAAFGGNLAAMLEELKAQAGALYYLQLLAKRGIIDEKTVLMTYLDGIVWTFGHISRGMYDARGGRKAYSQLAAIQLGFFTDEGAIVFDERAPAANGSDKGAFRIVYEKLPAAAEKLAKVVATIKAKNDKPGAEALAKRYVDGSVVPQALITERILRSPRGSFVYAYEL